MDNYYGGRMRKKETIANIYEHCGECPNCDAYEYVKVHRCYKRSRVRIIKDLWGEIPDWCPLETVEEG